MRLARADGSSRGTRMRRDFALSGAGLRAAFDFISETVACRGGDAAVARRLSVIVDEICGNLIRHDGSLTEADRFTLELTDAGGGNGTGAVLVISDPGRPFDPTELRLVDEPAAGPRPDPPATIGGYGLALVRGLSCAIRYERAAGSNWLTVSIAAEGQARG